MTLLLVLSTVAFLLGLIVLVRTARRRAREATPQRRSSDGPLVHPGTQPTPAQVAAMGRAAASVAQAQEAMQRLGHAAARAAPAAQQFSTAASRAQARQQQARAATVPAPRPKPPAPSPAPARRQDDDDGPSLAGMAATAILIDEMANSPAPDISMPDPTPDPPSFDGGGGDFGGGGSDGSW